MQQGCLLSLFIWAASSGAYWYVLRGRFAPPLEWIVPVVAGLVMTMAIGALRNAIASALEAMRASGDASVGGVMEPPKDGRTITVAGHIRAAGSALRAPFSGKPAVLYAYEIQHYGNAQNPVVKDYAGFGLTPAVVDSRRGPIRLLGFPTLDGFAQQLIDSDVARSNAASYLSSTQFSELGGFQVGAMYREIKELLTDDDGQLRKDWKMAADADLTDKSLYEQIVQPGEQVTVSGRYSAEKGGVVPDIRRGNAVRLVRGDAQASAGRMWQKAASNLIGFAIVAALLNGGMYSVVTKMSGHAPISMPKSASDIRKEREAFIRAAKDGDLATMQQMVDRGMSVDTSDDDGRTPLALAPDVSTVQWLIAHGANLEAANHDGLTPLMDHTMKGDPEIVAALVRAGAKLDTRDAKWKRTALMLALDAEKADIADILRKAGAHDDTVTAANGKSVTSRSESARVCMEWLEAVQREDVTALKRLSTFESLDGIDFNAWKGARPAGVTSIAGFENDEAATVTVRGPVPGNKFYCTYTYQLVRREGVWKIGGERWETRLDSEKP